MLWVAILSRRFEIDCTDPPVHPPPRLSARVIGPLRVQDHPRTDRHPIKPNVFAPAFLLSWHSPSREANRELPDCGAQWHDRRTVSSHVVGPGTFASSRLTL
jgi:hypothetical protein